MNNPRDPGATAPTDLHFLTLAQASRLIESKGLSPVEYVNALISRIDALADQINAFITRTNDLALKRARSAEDAIASGHYRGPLHGIPFALKDIYNTAGILTSGHSKVAQEHVPSENATTTQRLACGRRSSFLRGRRPARPWKRPSSAQASR